MSFMHRKTRDFLPKSDHFGHFGRFRGPKGPPPSSVYSVSYGQAFCGHLAIVAHLRRPSEPSFYSGSRSPTLLEYPLLISMPVLEGPLAWSSFACSEARNHVPVLWPDSFPCYSLVPALKGSLFL